jgi:hypothetical protein
MDFPGQITTFLRFHNDHHVAVEALLADFLTQTICCQLLI